MKNKQLPNQFELLDRVINDRRNSRLREGFAYLTAFVCLCGLVLMSMRPVPVVVKSDVPNEPSRLVFTGEEATVRNIDARKFLHKTAKLMHGWSSATVMDDLYQASTLMTTAWRREFLAAVNEEVPVDKSVNKSGKTERVATWAQEMIRNEIDISWDKTECKKEEKRWFCRARGSVWASSLLKPGEKNKARKRVEFRAAFVEVPTTEISIDGLLIDFFEVRELS